MVSSNTLTNIKMTNAIKGIVSKRKKRYKQDGFNLDLTYICDNIIAMGYPAKNLEGVYRNHIDDVINFLTTKHNNNYKIYNLCEEKKYQYDITKFQQCASFPFSDHNPPNIELIQSFCNDVHKWLSEDLKNVAAIHCKAGKGRTGTMICCYLLHSGQFNTAADALNFYGQKRTTDKKGVTIPSQRRYVEYYSQLLKSNKPYTQITLNICEIKLYNLPPIRTFGTLTYSITSSGQKIFTEQMTELKRVDNYVSIKLDRCLLLTGDVKIEFSCTQILKHKQKLFHFWFNTYFINEITSVDSDGNVIFELNKPEIDDAHKDKQKMFNENFKIETIFQKIPHGGNHMNRMQINHTTNGVLNNLNSRYNNLINNNNNNDINSTVLDSHNSDNHNHRVSSTSLRNASSSQRNNQISANEIRHSRGDNYQTTSEGSSSPESSSESSGEDWESGSLDKFQYELRCKISQKILKIKNRKKCLSKRMSDPLSKKGSFKAYTKSCGAHQRSRSNLHLLESYNKNNEIAMTKDLDKKLLSATSVVDERSTDTISSLMNRFGSLFQRRGSSSNNNNVKTPDNKQSPLSQSSSSICHIPSTTGELRENFEKVRDELSTLKKFS